MNKLSNWGDPLSRPSYGLQIMSTVWRVREALVQACLYQIKK